MFWKSKVYHSKYRNNHRRCSVRKGVLRNFAKFTGKHLCQSLFFNKVADLETLVQVFFCIFCRLSKNTFFIEHFRATHSVIWAYQRVLTISHSQKYSDLHDICKSSSFLEMLRVVTKDNLSVFQKTGEQRPWCGSL